MSRQTGTRLVLLFLSAVCLLSLGLPFVYRAGSDVWLQKRGTLRPVQADALSAQGQAVPLAYALYRNRFAPATALETSADAQQVQQELQEKLAALSAAGALPEPVTKRAGWIMAQQPADTTRKLENGFASATWLVLPEEEQTAYAVTACWQEKTDCVVSCTVSATQIPTDLAPNLAAYRSYLGLDALTDWEALPSEEGARAWSQAGQLALACRWRDGQFTLEAKSQAEKPWNSSAAET